MLQKNIASCVCTANPSRRQIRRTAGRSRYAQQGVTLIELLVGLAIGLLTIAVAVGALMVSRGISGTVTDASGIQQQAAYAMRVMGQQLRQTGSLRLNLSPGTSTAAEPYLAPVAFETVIPAPSASSPLESFDPTSAIRGTEAPVTVTMAFRRYTEPVFTNTAQQSFSRNCLGGPADTSSDQRLESLFQLVGSNLLCSGNGATAQPIVQNVANFQVRYLIQNNNTPGISTLKSVDATAVPSTDWAKIQAVEVCLVLYGNESIDMPSGSTYTDCDGTPIDMSTLTGERTRRMHVAFRNQFQLRSQGLVGSVL